MLYRKVLNDLRQRINSREFAIGDLLPTEQALMLHYEVSRITIRKAVDQLVGLGLVERKQGAGTFVRKQEVSHAINSLRSTGEYMKDANRSVSYQVIHFRLMKATPVLAHKLQLPENAELYYIRRLKSIDDVACIVEDSYMPVQLFPELNISTLRRSKYDFIECEKQMEIEGSHQDFFAVNPESEIVDLLELEKNQPVLMLTSLSNLKDGTFFDYSIAWFKPDVYQLSLYLKRHEMK